MKTIIVDDEIWSMQSFIDECGTSDNIELKGLFTDPEEALAYAKRETVDFALLDIEMPKISGLTLAKQLREYNPDMIIIFVTAYPSYSMEAIKQRADYIVFKPYNMDDINDALNRAKLLGKRGKKNIYIRTFGKFDVFVGGEPIMFKSGKAKEMLALMVDRNGGVFTSEELLTYLWEDKEPSEGNLSVVRTIFAKLMAVLKSYGADGLIIASGRQKYLSKKMCDCDYFDFLGGDKKAIDDFNYEYMSNYSWAESTLAYLSEVKNKN